MSDDIRAGDVVVCVDDRTITCDGATHFGGAVKRGETRRVEFIGVDPGSPCSCVCIWREGRPAGLLQRFRKVDSPDTEVSERIKACRPIKQREDA